MERPDPGHIEARDSAMESDADKLLRLWQKRGDSGPTAMTQSEWVELHHLVRRQLQKCKLSILASLREPRATYINYYFSHRVFETARRNIKPLYDPRVLCTYFERYLIARLRAQEPDPVTTIPSEDNDDYIFIIDLIGDDPRAASLAPDQDATDYGITLHQAWHSASVFLRTLKPWLIPVLARSLCEQDTDKPRAINLAQSLGAQSPAHHLDKLGITKKHQGASLERFRDSQLGRWMAGFGITLDIQNMEIVAWLYIQLCHAAHVIDQEEGHT
jgi:hypothetical protein